MFDPHIACILIGANVNHTGLKNAGVAELNLVRANDLNLINHYMLCKENMTPYLHLHKICEI